MRCREVEIHTLLAARLRLISAIALVPGLKRREVEEPACHWRLIKIQSRSEAGRDGEWGRLNLPQQLRDFGLSRTQTFFRGSTTYTKPFGLYFRQKV